MNLSNDHRENTLRKRKKKMHFAIKIPSNFFNTSLLHAKNHNNFLRIGQLQQLISQRHLPKVR